MTLHKDSTVRTIQFQGRCVERVHCLEARCCFVHLNCSKPICKAHFAPVEESDPRTPSVSIIGIQMPVDTNTAVIRTRHRIRNREMFKTSPSNSHSSPILKRSKKSFSWENRLARVHMRWQDRPISTTERDRPQSGVVSLSWSFNGRLQVAHRKTTKDGPITNVTRDRITIGEDGAGGRNQELIVLKPYKNLPRLELLKTAVENRESGLESVRLACQNCEIWRKLGSLVETVGQEDAIARIGGGKRSFLSWLRNRKWYGR
ncbi:hypothetical protein SDJN02_20455, partial [Cucurbita argyrosperma subsp. argyrosperma]